MKEETMEKFCRKLDTAYMYSHVVFAILLIIVSIGYAISNLICCDIISSLLFSVLAYMSYKLMLRASIEELRDFKNNE